MALDKKQLFSLIAVLVLSFSATAGLVSVSFGSPVYIPWVWHNIGIYVREDGTVDPSDAPIQRLGNVYSLKSDVFASIAIQCNDSVFDGNGYKLYGSGYGTALLLQNAKNIVVKNLNAQYFGQGIYFDNCNGSVIKSSKLVDCGVIAVQSSGNQLLENDFRGKISVDYGNNCTLTGNNASSISVAWSTNITIRNNRIADDKLGFSLFVLGNYTEGIYIDNSGNVTVEGNMVARKNVGVDIWQSTNVTFTNNELTGNQVGLKLWNTDPETLPEIDSTNTVNGKPVYFLINRTDYIVPSNAGWIFALNSKNLTVQNWVAEPNWDGAVFLNTQNSRIVNCTLSGNYNAIRFDNVSNCTLTRNRIINNGFAAFNFENAVNCTVTENEIVNSYCILDLWRGSTNNTFIHNDFVGNQTGLVENETRNQWDDGVEGNYWSTFTGVDRDHNGISDSPFLINSASGEADRFPLMEPISSQASPIHAVGNMSLSMPEEYLNYTLTNVDGALWAKIDGVYPMHLSGENVNSLPMVYPIPPNTTNIHVRLDGVELNWTDYRQIDPLARHHTEIGDWQMIHCVFTPVPSDFLLEIHYEHPVQVINGSYTFLYDLNMNPYLSASSAISTAHFRLALPANSSGLDVYRTGLTGGEWQRVNVTSFAVEGALVKFDVISEYGKPLMGDVAFVLRHSAVPELPAWITAPLFALLAIIVFVAFFRKRALKKTNNVSWAANFKYANSDKR
jgi:parallel beta-helix repeat protein